MYYFFEIVLAPNLEGNHAGEELESDGAHRPYIHSLVISNAFNHLW